MKKRFMRTMAVGTALLLLAVACAPREGIEQQLQTASELAESATALQAETGEVADILQDLGERLSALEEGAARFTAGAEVPVLGRNADIPAPPAGKVAVRLGFRYHPSALPGEGVQVYEPSPMANSLWAMQSLAKGEAVPIGPRIEDGVLFMEPGEDRLVTLAFQNPTADEVGFLVMPHMESPGSLGPHLWLTCLCMSFVYAAPPEGAWYRVIRVTVSPDMEPGSKVDTIWTVLTDSAVFPKD